MPSDEPLDLLVLGGGVMGLFTAYHASAGGNRVAVLERGEIGDPRTASFGRTRSYRKDYLDAEYARLADEAQALWRGFEGETGVRALVRCGCLNIASSAVTPNLASTYGQLSADVLAGIGLAPQTLSRDALAERYPYLDADVGHLDETAGLVDLRAVTGALLRALEQAKASVHQHVETTSIEMAAIEMAAIDTAGDDAELLRLRTDAGDFLTRALVITAGHGTNDLLALLPGCELRVPITRDRPSEAKYYRPRAGDRAQFTSDVMPVIAYLDTGVYVHPIVDGVVDAVKIGYYNPPDIPRDRTGVGDIADFVARCMPGLAEATGDAVEDVLDVDGCDYDLVADDEFVLGRVPGLPNVHVGVGWRGTGYKYAPWVGRVLFQLALRGGTVYDIRRFDPRRFDPRRFVAGSDSARSLASAVEAVR